MAKLLDEARAERRDVARFLARHEECASDFEIGRTAGGSGGRIGLACRGCGERAAYDIGEPGVLELVDEGRPKKPQGRRVTRAELERWLPAPAALPWWIPNAYIGVVILLGVALIAAGLLARGEREPVLFGGTTPSTTTEEAPAPVPSSAPVAERKNGHGDEAKEGDGKGGRAKGGEAKGGDGKGGDAKRGDSKAADRPELDMVTVLNRFAIGVPPGWLRGLSGGAVVFRPPSQEAELRVFLEPGDERPRSLSRKAADFLEGEHPSAKISRPRHFRLGGAPAVRLVANWDGGTERAALVSVSGYSYLLLSRVDKGASRPTRTQAVAALYSFNPL